MEWRGVSVSNVFIGDFFFVAGAYFAEHISPSSEPRTDNKTAANLRGANIISLAEIGFRHRHAHLGTMGNYAGQ